VTRCGWWCTHHSLGAVGVRADRLGGVPGDNDLVRQPRRHTLGRAVAGRVHAGAFIDGDEQVGGVTARRAVLLLLPDALRGGQLLNEPVGPHPPQHRLLAVLAGHRVAVALGGVHELERLRPHGRIDGRGVGGGHDPPRPLRPALVVGLRANRVHPEHAKGGQEMGLADRVRRLRQHAGTVHDRLKEPVLVLGKLVDEQDVMEVRPGVACVLRPLSWVPPRGTRPAAAPPQQGEGRGIPQRSVCGPTLGRSR